MTNAEQVKTTLLNSIQQKSFEGVVEIWQETFLKPTEKNMLLVMYLEIIYRLQGWRVILCQNHKIPHLLLYHVSRQQPFIIVRWNTNKQPLSYDKVEAELAVFEEELAPMYGCWQFNLVVPTGTAIKAQELRSRNMLLSGWQYLRRLVETNHPVVELLAHNQIAYENTVRLFETNRQVAVVQATGTGKTYVIGRKIEDYAQQKVWVLAPSHVILGQVKKLVAWHNNVEFMTYAKTTWLTDDDLMGATPALIILDEFHRAGSEGWGEGVLKILNAFPQAKIFGTSATPIRYLDGERDMSDELFDGVVAENLPLREAIERRILPKPKYITALWTLSEETERVIDKIQASQLSDQEKIKLVEQVHGISIQWEKTSGIPAILSKHLGKDNRKIIVFCPGGDGLEELINLIKSWFIQAFGPGSVTSYIAYYKDLDTLGYQGKDKMNQLSAFRKANPDEDFCLLFAVEMLNEGLHIDDVGAAIQIRRTKSPRVQMQQWGRAIQVDSLYPLLFDLVNNFRNVRGSSEEEGGGGGGKRDPSSMDSMDILDETRDFEEALAEIEARTANWEVMYEELVKFKKKNRALQHFEKK